MSANNNEKLVVLPLTRIKMIMRSSPDVGNISPDSCFLVTKATEGFISSVVRQALVRSENKSRVDYGDLAAVVASVDHLDFLRDIVPPKIQGRKYRDMLALAEETERRQAKEDQEL